VSAAASAGKGLPRAVEAAAAAAGLVMSAPLLLLAAAAIVATTAGSPVFRQRRVGRNGRLFTLVKLRTMRRAAGAEVTARGDERVTRVGRLLRRTKIDELPELWNVLRGDMAFVGPRPEVPRYFDAADPRWGAVLAARPGLTDPVTLRLRNEEELLAGIAGDREAFYRDRLQPWKLRGYADYLSRRTWRTDLIVLRDTVRAVLRPGTVLPPAIDDVLAEGLHPCRFER